MATRMRMAAVLRKSPTWLRVIREWYQEGSTPWLSLA